jgi:hypothetical protein
MLRGCVRKPRSLGGCRVSCWEEVDPFGKPWRPDKDDRRSMDVMSERDSGVCFQEAGPESLRRVVVRGSTATRGENAYCTESHHAGCTRDRHRREQSTTRVAPYRE